MENSSFQALSFITCISDNLSSILPYRALHLKPCYLGCKSYSSFKHVEKQILCACVWGFSFPSFPSGVFYGHSVVLSGRWW